MKQKFCAFTIILFFLTFPLILKAQGGYEDVVYLKNGSIIHGLIIEQIPNQSIKIQTRDNNVFVYKMDEIEKMTREQSSGKSKKGYSKKSSNLYVGMYVGVGLAMLRPDAEKFCDAMADAMNSVEGFSNFSFYPKPRIGFTAGFMFMGRIAGSFFLQSEVAYTMKGNVINGNGTYESGWSNYDVTVDETFILNYLNIPLYAKYYIFNKGLADKAQPNFNVYVMAGPSLGIALAKKMKTVATVAGQTSDDKQTYDGFSGIDFGIDFGVGFGFLKSLDFEFRYNMGLKNVLKEEAADNVLMKNNRFTITLGYTWPI